MDDEAKLYEQAAARFGAVGPPGRRPSGTTRRRTRSGPYGTWSTTS